LTRALLCRRRRPRCRCAARGGPAPPPPYPLSLHDALPICRGYGQTTSGGLLTWLILRRPPAATPTVPRDGASTPPNASQCTSPPADAAPTAAPNSNPAGTATTSLPGPEEGPPTPSTDRRAARPATCGKGISLP